jgi:putative transposase
LTTTIVNGKPVCGFAAFRAERLSLSGCQLIMKWRLRLMFRISKDSPVYYLTSVANNRLPIFQKEKLKKSMCESLDEARTSAGLLLFAYVIMPDHIHVLTGSQRKPSEVLRYVNGISGRRIIDFLKEGGFESSLHKLSHFEGERQYKYSVWDHHSNVKLVTTENGLLQKVNYIHQNPVRAGLVEPGDEYRWSSARCWQRKPLEDEPLLMDIDQIAWHRT